MLIGSRRHAAGRRQAACPPLAMPKLYQAITDDLCNLCEALLECGLVVSKRTMIVKVQQGTGLRS